MKNVSRLIGSNLKWVQPSAFNMHYELRTNNELAGTLSFRSAFGSFATGESADGCWTFKRVGFFQTRVTIRLCGSDHDLATFRNNTWSGGGTLEFPDGRKLLADTNFWQTSLQFSTESGEPLVRFNTGGMIHLSATIDIWPVAAALAELPLIVMLGWYLVVMMHSDMAASAAIIG
ncbi:MAG TPA: hypothetical protein VLM38_10275 [Blastocatellia bacterium]|nr:hypothetical protein [Blastocatellia bacterium]